MRRPDPRTVRWGILIAMLVLWELVPLTGLLPELFLPRLSKTLHVLWTDLDKYCAALLVTLYEVALAMVIACGFGIVAGATIGGIAVLRDLLLPVFSSLYAVPIVILYPIFTAWFGIGSESKIMFAGIYGFFPVMLSTAAGIRTIDPQFLLAARSMGATVYQQITRVIIPASLPTVFGGLRLGGALAIIGVVVSEMLTASAGIGYLVTLNRTILDSPRVFAGILAILVLSVAYDILARALERRMVVWQSAGRKEQTSPRPVAGARRRRPPHRGIARIWQYRLGAQANALEHTGRTTDGQQDPAHDRGRQLPAARLARQPRDAVEVRAARAHEHLAHSRAQLEQAQDDATILAIRDMERAGIDIITDGEARRESYSNRFATALEGIDAGGPARSSHARQSVVDAGAARGRPIRRTHAVEVRDMEFLRRNTDRLAKITLPGPFTMSQQAKNEFYKDADEMVMDYAAAVNAEAHDLVKAGADVIQLDEPWLRNDPDAAKRIAIKAINRALEGIKVPTVVHLCFGYAAVVPGSTKPVGYSFLPELADTVAETISIEAAQPKLDLGILKELSPKKVMLGVLDLGDKTAETAERSPSASARASIRRRRQARPGARLRHEVYAARAGLRKAEGARRWCCPRSGRTIVESLLFCDPRARPFPVAMLCQTCAGSRWSACAEHEVKTG